MSTQHVTTITDATYQLGYGPLGHGSWRVSCACGWSVVTTHGGRNAAEAAAWQHRVQANKGGR